MELADRLGFHLTHTFTGHFEDAAHFFERVGVAVPHAVPKLEDFALSVGKGLEDFGNALTQHLAGRGIGG